MAKVFVSYSRKDITFAKRLTAELQKCELDFWIDWEGIPPTVDWWREIEKGIEESDIYLFLISPDSVKSRVCGQEIDTAVKNGKRIIPIVVRDSNWDETPAQLRHLNYIFVRERDDFEAALNKLTAAIQTDYEWAATHRRLQVKALDWERNGKDHGFLLRGRDLIDAEQDLATNTSKDPHPTDLQREFVFESRKATDRQRRVVTSISVIGFVVMALLTIFALIQLNISRAQQLGFQAQVAFADENYNTALLYAYQSNLIYKNQAANQVLSQLPYRNFVLGKAIDTDTSLVNSMAWSPNGQLTLVLEDGKVVIWDLNTGQPAKILESDMYSVRNAIWSSDGRLASVSEDGKVVIWDLNTGQPAKILESDTYSVAISNWSPDGQLASISGDGMILVWDLNTGRLAQVLGGKDTHFASQISWSPSGHLASVSGSSDNVVILWDLKTGQPAQILKGHTDIVMDIAWSPKGQLASASQDFRVILWDLDTGQPAQTLRGHNATITDVDWSADEQLASASLDKTVIIWDLSMGRPFQTLKGHSGFVNEIIWSPNGQVASISSDNTVIIWDLNGKRSAQTLVSASAANSVAWSADEQLASASRDGTVIIWDLKTGQAARTIKDHTDEVRSIAWSPNGLLASVSVTLYQDPQVADESQIMIWHPTTGQSTQIVKTPSVIRSLAWSTDRQLASGSADGAVIIWNLETGKSTETLTTSSGINSVAWSLDGQLASGSADGAVIIWNLETGQPAQTMQAPATVHSVAWSPSGQLASASWSVPESLASLASTSGLGEGEVTLWNIQTGRPFRTLKDHSNSINSIAWSPSGQLASASWDQTVKIARSALITGEFCSHIYRNMTIEEWLTTQGALYIYRPACPNLYDPSRDSLSNGIFQQGFSDFEDLGVPKALSKAITYVFLAIAGPIITWRDPTQLDVDPRVFLVTWQGRAILLIIYGVFLFLLFSILRALLRTGNWIWRKVRKQKAISTPIPQA